MIEDLGASEFFSRPDKSSIHIVDCRISTNLHLFKRTPARGHEFVNLQVGLMFFLTKFLQLPVKFY